MPVKFFRKTAYKHLSPKAWDGKTPSPVTYIILFMIFFSIVLFSIETELSLLEKYSVPIAFLNLAIAVLFAIEYFTRVWVCVEDEKYQGKFGRLKFIISPMAVIDLIAFLPAFIFTGSTSAFWLRLLRVFRILRIVKLGRYSTSLQVVFSAIKRSWRELIVTFGVALSFLYFSAVTLYFVEAEAQPEAFGSIPRSIWWAVATLTTVGYGDVYPITALGKICAGIIALIGIAIIALPAAILAGAFIEEYRDQKKKD